MWGAQDCQRVEQGRGVGAGEHEERSARDLLGVEPGFRRSGDRRLRREIRGEACQRIECLTKDLEALLALYDFPAEHWDHLRTTNPIESVFATVRHRTVRTKGSLSPTTAKLMVFKLLCAASKTWRRLKGTNQLPKVIGGVRFQDGIEVIEVPANHAA